MTHAIRPSASDRDTRARLLEAAIRLFAESGFKRVTVRAICRAAHANVAAVNYHFRNKLGLYREVTDVGIAVLQQTTALAVKAASSGTPEERLRAFIGVVIRRLLETSGHEWLQRFVAREMADPTPALASFVDRGMKPRLDQLGIIIGDILQLPPTDPQVIECVTSVHAQMLMFRTNPITERLRPSGKVAARSAADIADHITAFSLAGIHAIRAADSRKAVSAGSAR